MKWGASTREALYLSSILNAAAFFGCYTWGLAADAWMGPFDTLTLAAFCAAITTFGWIGVRTYTGTVAWSVAYGFMSGGVQALFSPCLSHLAPSPALIATWNGEKLSSIATFLWLWKNFSFFFFFFFFPWTDHAQGYF